MTHFASNTDLYTVEHMEYELNFECEEKVEDGMVWIKYGEHWYPEREATLDFPFADLNDDEFLDLYPGARFFAYPTPVPYYECDDDDMEYFKFYDMN